MTAVLAIDQGTSGTKAIVVDDAGVVIAECEEPVRPSYRVDGGVEVDPRELLESVLVAGRRALAAAERPVDAVALANQGETVLAWDRTTGIPLSPAIVWQDRRAEAICTALEAHRPRIEERTGLVLDPYFSAPKLAWLRQSRTTEGVVTTSDCWLIWQLTQEFVTDVSTASRSLVMSLDRREWDDELLELFGLAGEALPRIAANDEIAGWTTAFGPRLPLAGIVVDQQAALFAEGCVDAGLAKCTFGTGAFLLANVGSDAIRSTSGLTTSVAWTVRGRTSYCIDGPVYTAASAVRWLQDIGLLADVTELDTVAAVETDDVLCVTALAGLAAPRWRADATASFTGLTLATTRGQLVRAVLDGIAAQVAEVAELAARDLAAPLTSLRVDGGLTRCRTLMQATADLLQRPVEVYPSANATALGAAGLARLALEPTLEPADAVTPWTAAEVFEPRWSADRAYAFRARWSAAADANLPARSA